MLSSSPFSDAYTYTLPAACIAQQAVVPRDEARLLCVQQDTLTHHRFFELPALLPVGASIFFNESAVLPVRLRMHKATTAAIEVLLVEAVAGSPHFCDQLHVQGTLRCQAWIRPSRRVPVGTHLYATGSQGRHLTATRYTTQEIQLSWEPKQDTFQDMLTHFGEMPIPPYMRRAASLQDKQSYQCVYSQVAGSVAAPTAGLHFTPKLLQNLKTTGFALHYLRLHVGAGTFLPLQGKNLREHPMHAEHISVTQETLCALQANPLRIAVGTTSLRSIESLYWYGCLLNQCPTAPFDIPSFVYEQVPAIPPEVALMKVVNQLTTQGTTTLVGCTALYITPGYRLRLIKGLITNFHQPSSTLLVLLAALIGPRWRTVYAEAMQKGYRFLSYGDACFFLF